MSIQAPVNTAPLPRLAVERTAPDLRRIGRVTGEDSVPTGAVVAGTVTAVPPH